MARRNHNYIADMLFKINEKGQFKDWDSLNDAGQKWQDNEIFGTARLINCCHYAQVVLHDYLRRYRNCFCPLFNSHRL